MSGISVDMNGLEITRPTLLLDRSRAMRSIERMVRRAESSDVVFRPHFKTHQSVGVGRWFRDFGVKAIAVTSVEMARYFAEDGWSDITIAFPVNTRELPAIAELAERVRLGVLVDSAEVVETLEEQVDEKLRVWIKIDAGYGRAGIAWDNERLLLGVTSAVQAAGNLELAGVLSHNGLTYRERTPEGVKRVHELAMGRMRGAASVVAGGGNGRCAISIGDTPSASVIDNFEDADEIRPGNFVFNDLTQEAIGSCTMDDIAVAVACPVVAVYPERGTALLYGGAVHLSLDSLEDTSGSRVFGQVSTLWPEVASAEAPVISLSQEHGVVALPDVVPEQLRPGGLVYVLPVHSCLTCNLYPEYVTLDGEKLTTLNGARRA